MCRWAATARTASQAAAKWRLSAGKKPYIICCTVKTSVVDPDPHWSALILVIWIRIRIQEGKNDPQKRKIKNSEEISYFEMLDVFLKPVIGSIWKGYRDLLKNPYRTDSISSVGMYESQYSVKGFGPFLQGFFIDILMG
jgi:hypothetical protein